MTAQTEKTRSRSVADFTAAMKGAVEERGEGWTYPLVGTAPEWFTRGGVGGCRYRLPDGSPGCIVGAALNRLGLLDQATEGESAARVLTELGFSPVLADAADRAQAEQDMGSTWGEALQSFLTFLDSKAAA